MASERRSDTGVRDDFAALSIELPVPSALNKEDSPYALSVPQVESKSEARIWQKNSTSRQSQNDWIKSIVGGQADGIAAGSASDTQDIFSRGVSGKAASRAIPTPEDEYVLNSTTNKQKSFEKRAVSFQSGMSNVNRQSPLSVLLDKYRKRRALANDNDEAYIEGARKITQFMHNLWVDQIMCDIAFTTDGGEVLAHQVAVSAYSPTLASLLRQKQRGVFGQTAQIEMCDFPRDIVADVVNFVYTTDIELDCRNIGQILACARQLDMPIIVRICQDYLIDNCDPDNIILHYSIAANNSLTDVRDRLLKVICQGFCEIYCSRHFVFLPIDRLMTVLTNDNLCSPEVDVFLAIVRWIDFNRTERLPFAKQLLALVRYQNIDPDLLATQVQPVDWIFADRECLDPVLDAYK